MLKKIFLFSFLVLFSYSLTAQTFTLDSLKNYALQYNKSLQDAKLEIEASQTVEKKAFTKYFPTVEAGAVAMRTNRPLLEVDIPEMNLPVYDGNPMNLLNPTQFTYFPGMSIETLDYANVGQITAIQPLFTGGRIYNGNQLAELGTSVSTIKYEMASDAVILKVEEYYWQLVALNEKKKTIQSYEALLNTLQADVTVAVDAGLIQKTDLLKVKMEQNNISLKKMQLENGIALLKMALAQTCGMNYDTDITVNDSVVEILSPESFYTNPNDALSARNEFELLNKSIEAQIINERMTRGEYLPQIAIGAQALYADMFDKQETYGIAFATISIPISGWWEGTYEMQEHKIRTTIAQNNLEEKSDLLMLQMQKQYNELTEAYKSILVAELSCNQAKEHLKVVEDNYKAGVLAASDLLEAQAIYQGTLDALIDAKSNYKFSQTAYKQAIGQM